MKNLLKADFYRAKHDKLLKVGLIISAALPVLFCLLFFLIYLLSKYTFDGIDETISLRSFISVTELVQIGISVGGVGGLIAPIFISIFLVKDFKNRTIRNKVTMGYSRRKIYFSLLIVAFTYSVIYTLAYVIVTLALGSCLFNFAPIKEGVGMVVDGNYIITFILNILLNLLCSFVTLSFIFMIAINKQNIAIAIVIPVVLTELLSILTILIQSNDVVLSVFSFTNYIQASELSAVYYLEDLVASGVAPLNVLARTLITTPIYLFITLFFGQLWFKKVDFK